MEAQRQWLTAMASRQRVPAIEGWFTLDKSAPTLLGTRCAGCGTYFFPKELRSCRNPSCGGTELEEVPLSRRGRIWSYTINHYAPPSPAVAEAPYGVAAVELAQERMIVLGQIEGDAAGLRVGDEMELTVGSLYEDDEGEYLVWKWKPVR